MSDSLVIFFLAGYCPAVYSAGRSPQLKLCSRVDRKPVFLAVFVLVVHLVPQSALLTSATGAALDVTSAFPNNQCSALEANTRYFQPIQTHAYLNILVKQMLESCVCTN